MKKYQKKLFWQLSLIANNSDHIRARMLVFLNFSQPLAALAA